MPKQPPKPKRIPAPPSVVNRGKLEESFSEAMEKQGCPEPTQTRKEPLWKGPEVDGVTQSLLGRFLECRERFRLLTIEGIKLKEGFNHRLEYGNMWHVCEETLAKDQVGGYPPWHERLKEYAQTLTAKYRLQQDQVIHWYNVCKMQFPFYVKYWQDHPDMVARKPLLQEKVFRVPYKLPSGQTVILTGKWDSVDEVKGFSILQENKTKGDINEQNISKQLTFDVQTMFYLTALNLFRHQDAERTIPKPIGGVRYNVVRRPLSGGKGSIKRKEPTKTNPQGETHEQFYARLGEYVREEPGYFFMRWDVPITNEDIMKFCRTFLDPILEQLCDWYSWVSYCKDDGCDPFAAESTDGSHKNNCHWRHPFGVYSTLNDGGSTDLDDHLATGSMVGLDLTENLFPELT